MAQKFTVEAKTLKDAVLFTKAALAGSSKSLEDKVLRVDVTPINVALTASDGNLIAAASADAKVEGGGGFAFAVIGARLSALVAQAQAVEYVFEVDDENVQITANAGSDGRSDLVVNFERYDSDLLGAALRAQEALSGQEFGPAELEIPRARLVEALAVAESSTTKSPGTPAFGHVELRDGRFLAADGRKFSSVRSDHFHSAAKLKIPVPILGRLATALKALNVEKLHPFEGTDHFYLLAQGRTLAIRKTDMIFPAVEKVLDKRDQAADVIQVGRGALIAALQDVGLGLPSGEVGIGVKLPGHVQGGWNQDPLEITAKNTLGRVSRKQIPVARTVDAEIEFSLSIDILLSTLQEMKGDEVQAHILVSAESVLIVDKDAEREIAVFLPFRTGAAKAAETPQGEVSVPGAETAAGPRDVDGDEIVL